MRIVFHGAAAATFRPDIEALLEGSHTLTAVSSGLGEAGEHDAFAAADAVVGVRADAGLPLSSRLRLFQVPGAGYDLVDLAAVPPGAFVCNCFGHENAIAEYVMAALLARHVPLAEADRHLRRGDWKFFAGGPSSLRTELGETTLGILGFGHTGKAVAARARAFGMRVLVANRTPAISPNVDAWFGLDALGELADSADAVVNTLPLTADTRGLVGADILARMHPDAVVVNVGRGPVVDEAALFDALKERRIGGAVIDTWYRYPRADDPGPQPSSLPFGELDNVVMTPHMSGWTHGTIARRRAVIADNINRVAAGREPVNQIPRPPTGRSEERP